MQYHICRYKYSCILGYPTGYSQPNTPIKWNAKKCGADIIVVRTSWGTFARFPHRNIGVIMPTVADD